MKRLGWIVVAVLVLALAVGAGVGLRLWSQRTPKEPTYGGRTQEAWLERLRSVDIEEGTKSWQELADLGESAVPVLLEARKDADVRVHRRAALALVKVGEPAVPGLVEALPRGGDRVEVILVRIGKPAVPALEKALQDRERAKSAARVLGGMGGRARDLAVVRALSDLMLDPKADVEARAEAARALGYIGPENREVVVWGDPLIGRLALAAENGPPKVQAEAARALGTCGPAARPAVGSLVLLTREKDVEVARAACESMGDIRSSDTAKFLVARMQEADDASGAAASALARLGPAARPALGALIASLKSEKADAGLARAVLERLGPVAVPELIDALKGKEKITRRAAADVLGLMGPRAAKAASDLEGMLKDADPAVMISAASALVRIEPEKTKPILAALGPLLTHKDEQVATAAAAVLGDLGPDADAAVPTLRKLLASKDEKAVSRAALALGRIRAADRETITELVSAATKGPEKARPACVEALGKVGPGAEAALGPLADLLKLPALRPHAAVAMRRIDPAGSRAAEALRADLEGEDESARARALAALPQMRPVPGEVLEAIRPLLTSRQAHREAFAILARMEPSDLRPLIPHLVALLEREARAVTILQRIGEPALPALLSALKDRSPKARAAAAWALASPAVLGEKPDLAPLVAALEDPQESVRLSAAESIAAHGATDELSAEAMLKLLAHPRAEFRRAAVRSLRGHMSRRGEVSFALLECLIDPVEGVRLDATHALVWEARRDGKAVPTPEAIVEARKAASEDPSASVHLAALTQLPPRPKEAKQEEWTRSEQLATLRDEDFGMRLEMARSLATAAPPQLDDALPLLLGILEGWDEAARLRAAATLKEIGPAAKPALAALRRRIRRDDSDEVRRACREATKAIEAKGEPGAK